MRAVLKSIFTADSSTSRVPGLTMPVSMDVNVANSAVCYGHTGCEDPIEKVYQYVGCATGLHLHVQVDRVTTTLSSRYGRWENTYYTHLCHRNVYTQAVMSTDHLPLWSRTTADVREAPSKPRLEFVVSGTFGSVRPRRTWSTCSWIHGTTHPQRSDAGLTLHPCSVTRDAGEHLWQTTGLRCVGWLLHGVWQYDLRVSLLDEGGVYPPVWYHRQEDPAPPRQETVWRSRGGEQRRRPSCLPFVGPCTGMWSLGHLKLRQGTV